MWWIFLFLILILFLLLFFLWPFLWKWNWFKSTSDINNFSSGICFLEAKDRTSFSFNSLIRGAMKGMQKSISRMMKMKMSTSRRHKSTDSSNLLKMSLFTRCFYRYIHSFYACTGFLLPKNLVKILSNYHHYHQDNE